jgi:exosortase D (VPLPA-CTERM-specific)
VIGILVNSYGIEQAEGFLHYFEGWVIFMSCVALMFAEMWLLTRLTQPSRSFRDTFNLDFGEAPEGGWRWPRIEPPLVFAMVVVGVTAIGLQFVQHRDEIVPERTRFSAFPLQVDDWRGVEEQLEPRIVKALDVEDYILANYVRPDDKTPVNFYVAYYSSQRKGASIHSPRSCLPGHDWEMEQLSVRRVEGLGTPFQVNRVVISKAGQRQLVYYWFEQRGRKLTSEFATKAYLLWDAIKLNRTDGALVRLTTPVPRGTDIAAAEQRMQDLLRTLYPKLSPYIPN